MPRGVHRQVLCAALIWSPGCGAATTTAAPGTPEPVARAASAAPVGDPVPVAPLAQPSSAPTPVADPQSSATPVAGSSSPPANPWFPDYKPQGYKACAAKDYAGLLACLDTPGVAGTEVKGKLVVLVLADPQSPARGLDLVKRGVLSEGLRTQLVAARVSVRKSLAAKGAPFASARFEEFEASYRADASTFTWSKRSSKQVMCKFAVDIATFTVSDDAVSEVVTSTGAEPVPGCCILL